jgi:hypothetical protein
MMFNSLEQCHLCRNEYTSMHVEVKPGVLVYACSSCLEKAKDSFIWVCVNCGKAYFRPKEQVLDRLEGYGLENATLLCNGTQLIMGIEICIDCDPQGILEYVQSGTADLDVELCKTAG